MANELSLTSLRLSVEERERVAEVAGDLIAIQVYRALQSSGGQLAARGGNIIANCCSCSSKDALLGEAVRE